MKKSGILLIILSGCLIHALGQEKVRFHSYPAKFFQEAREFFGERQPEDSRAILLKIETAQKNGDLPEIRWVELIRKANLFEKAGAQPFPDFYLFLKTFLEISVQTKDRPGFQEWSGYLDKLLLQNKKNLKPVRTFLEFTLDFSQKGILYSSSSLQWKVKAGLNGCGVDSSFFVMVSQSNLVATGSGDSSVIYSTFGRYYPETRTFYGVGGRITWERLKIPVGQVSVNLGKFRLDLSKSVYTIDSVNLIDNRYFSSPLIGVVEDKILPGVAPEKAGYPRFTSYDQQNRIKNLYPGMDYQGGFSLQGLKVLGIGQPSSKAVLTVFYKQKPFLRLASPHFTFQPGQARGINTEASIYLETDSIYHPGLLFTYNAKQNEISLIRDGQGISPSRFLNTYHNYDLNVDMIKWYVGDSIMTMTGLPGGTENRATFESAGFFNIDRYNEILMADKKHPVAAVKQAADYYYSRNYSLSELAKFMGMPQHLVEEMLLRLSFLGFVKYDSERQQVEVVERAYDFLKKNAGLQDYDVITFESVHEAPEANAVLSLINNRLKVFWVKSIELSQSRKVTIYPANQSIEILKDRDILFEGEIQAGLVRLSGRKFHFSYEDFVIRLQKVGQLKIQVYEKPAKKNLEPVLANVSSIIEFTRGILKIDEPNNKSGLKVDKYPEYPIMQTDTSAYVYYDQKDILNGIYPRETFNFTIYPFTLKGLNLLSFADSLIFPGQFMTAGIFPPLKLSLRHQTDHTLGFETLKTPEEGYPVYGGKGRFFNRIAMSKAGLRGSGQLEYLNSTQVSDDFLFLPEKVTSEASLFAVNQSNAGEGNPETRGQKMRTTWNPKIDKITASSVKEVPAIYSNGKFSGELSLTPNSYTGKGTINFEGYSITSDEFSFFKDKYAIHEGILRIFRDSVAERAVQTPEAETGSFFMARQYNGLVDVKGQRGRFEPVSGASDVVFTKNRFEGKPKSFDWDIAAGQLNLNETRFNMASKPSDSLNFSSGQADFALKDLALKAHQVDFIDVADVRIFPADRNLAIRKFAKIDTLSQAVIVSRDTTLVHKITNATVSIIDHKRYNASGYYQYRDIAKRDLPILFSDIQPDKKGVSTGKGTIPVENNFSLSPAFKYYGSVEWNNDERYLLFDGQTQLSHSCPNISLHWIRFTSRIFPDSVAIPIDSVTKNDQDERLYKGFFLSNQPIEFYSTFVGPHLRYSDQPLITTNGLLWFDSAKNQYKLSSAAKKANPDSDGPVLSMDVNACINEGKGPLTLGVDLGQVKLNGAGRLRHDLAKDSLTGSVILAIDFFFDPKILDFMAKSINNAVGLEPVNYGDAAFRDAFRDLVGRSKGEELLRQLSLTGKWKKLPDELLHTLVITDFRFKWNPETGSYQSTGKIGIGNILSEPINKKVNGYLEVIHRRGGDAFTIYIEIDRQNYFFLTYTRGVMQCVAGSGFEKFNTMIRSAKEADRKQKTGPGETEYQYYIGTYQQVREFLRRFSVER